MKKLLSSLLIMGFLVSNFTGLQVNAAEINVEQNSEAEIVTSAAENDINEEYSQQNENMVMDENIISEAASDSEGIQEGDDVDSLQIQEENADKNSDSEQNPEQNKPIDLKWNPDKPGSFSFNPNNTEGTEITVYVYKDNVRQYAYTATSFSFDGICESDISQHIEESGDYTLRVHVLSDHDDLFNDDKGILSDYSDVFHYIKPEQKINAPVVEWNQDAPRFVKCNAVEHAKKYEINVSNNNFIYYWVAYADHTDEEIDFVNIMEPNTTYKLRARAFSDNINLYAHSDYSEVVEYYFTGSNSGNITNNENSVQTVTNSSKDHSDNEEIVPHFWTPTTEEEQLRYSCFGKENIQYTTSNNQPFNINIQNAMQGEKCFEVFKNAADDYTIARTYNIYPVGSELKYSTEDKITVSLTIPEILRKENREFKMICVSQNGVPYVYADQDKNSDTITFDTDKFYAFALVYKDIK